MPERNPLRNGTIARKEVMLIEKKNHHFDSARFDGVGKPGVFQQSKRK